MESEWLFVLLDRLSAVEPQAWLLVVAVLLLTITGYYFVRWVRRAVLRARAAAEFGLSRIPRTVGIHRGPFVDAGSLMLSFPRWRYAKRDGTADRRRSNNHLVGAYSRLALGRYRLTSLDPFIIYDLAQAIRRNGFHIAWTPEERDKALSRERHASVLGNMAGAAAISAAYGARPTDFEDYCAELLRAFGYRARVTPPSRDGGYDLELEREGVRAIAECKCFAPSSVVGRPLLQKLVGANATVRAERLMFLTTATYSREAKEYAQAAGIELIDGQRLAEMAREAGGPVHVVHTADGAVLSGSELWDRYPADVRPSMTG